MPVGYQPDRDEWLTVKQAARYCQVTPMAIYKRLRSGYLPAYTFGGRTIRIKQSDLIRPHPRYGPDKKGSVQKS